MIKASIVIPNYDGLALLEENIPYVLRASEYPSNNIDEIIVVDDGSKDESVAFLKRKFPEIRIIKHKINRGFSAAVNTGVRSAKGDLIVLLNTDVRPDKDFLAAAIPHFENKKIFAVSFHEEGFGWAKGIFKDGFIVHESGQENTESHPTFWVSGGSGVFRRETWISLGGMDEKLFGPAYWEDLDISYRALKRGMKLLWEPNSKVFHEHEATVSKLPPRYLQRVQERNQLLFIWKNLTSAGLFRKHVAGVIKRMARSPGYIRIVFMALGKFGYILRLRNKERKEAKVSDEAIFASF